MEIEENMCIFLDFSPNCEIWNLIWDCRYLKKINCEIWELISFLLLKRIVSTEIESLGFYDSIIHEEDQKAHENSSGLIQSINCK